MARFLGLGNGSDGAVNLSSYTLLKYSCSGTSGSYSLTATGSFVAGQRLFIHQSRGTGVGGYEDNTVASYSSGTVTLVHPLERTYTDSGDSQAQVLIVKEASSVTGSITVPAWDGNVGGVFAIACSGTFNGTVDASGNGYRGSNGSTDNWGGNPQNAPLTYGYYGEGTTGAIGTQTNNNANGNGAGASSNGTDVQHHCAGSGGGHATDGTQGGRYSSNGYGGYGGGSVGVATLTSLFFGGGGSGARGHQSETYGNGGGGGGIIVVYTNHFSSTAQLTANGASGTAGKDVGGGGGAGGSILIKATTASIGTSKVTASAGSGNTSGNPDAGNGAVGRIRIEACSLSGSTSPGASTSVGGHNYCGILTGMI